jgi:chorismate--pyruvate lyase
MALLQVDWHSPEEFTFPNDHSKNWLLEADSLSKRLAQCCTTLSVELYNNKKVQASELAFDEQQLLENETSLLREVILRGDRHDWVYGRTIIPQSSLQAQTHDLENQGNEPLGLTVFSSKGAYRDALQVGTIVINGQSHLARRSRLWMNHKPMLVAEVFLMASPIYKK